MFFYENLFFFFSLCIQAKEYHCRLMMVWFRVESKSLVFGLKPKWFKLSYSIVTKHHTDSFQDYSYLLNLSLCFCYNKTVFDKQIGDVSVVCSAS